MRIMGWLLSLLMVLSPELVQAQATGRTQFAVDMHFRPLEDNRKLSQQVINDIQQDAEGFIWIATDDGLNRYDGQDNRIYRPSSIRENHINHYAVKRLAVDKDGLLWVGTEQGLNIYHAEQDNFSAFPATGSGIPNLTDVKVRALKVDSLNRIWVGMKTGGVALISADRKSLKSIPLSDSKLANKPLFVHDFFETDAQEVYAATWYGLLRYDAAEGKLLPVAATRSKNITQATELQDGSWLLGSSKGLWRYQPAEQTLRAVLPESFNDKHIVAIKYFTQEQYFVGTRSDGLLLVDLRNPSFRQFTADPADRYALTDNQIESIYRSADGLIWVGTNIGISILDPQQLRFGHISTYKQPATCLASNTIYAILPDRRKQLWIGAYGHGLNRINLSDGSCEFMAGSTPDSQDLKDIVALHEDGQDIWLGTFKDGVIKYDGAAQRFIPLAELVKGQDKVPTKVQAISSDGQGVIWIATYGAGLFRYDSLQGQLTQIVPESENGRITAFNDVTVDKQGNVWAAAVSKGLWQLTKGARQFVHIDGLPERLWSVDMDLRGRVWLGTAGQGAVVYEPESGAKKRYTLEHGLLNNVVLNIRQDRQGDMWLFTDRGLSRLSVANNRIHTFVEQDGLQGDTFTTAGYFDHRSGMLWTGGVNGFNRFDPRDIQPSNSNQKVILSNFELSYKPVALQRDDDKSPLQQVIRHTDVLTLSHKQNVFAFGFSALEYAVPEQIQFAFMLEGYDDSWNIVGADRRFANYTNIDPGYYTFKVKATNADGYWSDEQTTVAIHILPPWWSTKMAMAGYVIAAWLGIYLFVSFRTRSLSRRAQTLALAVESRTQELADEKQKVEQLLARKNEEFATVSHEFRTPLTLILGPLSQLQKVCEDQEHKYKLSIIERNGYRLLRMVDQLLNLETFKVKAINQKKTQTCGQIVRLVCEAFVDLAKQKDIRLQLGQVADVNFALIPDALEKILLNLVSNAIKYSHAGGVITVTSRRTSQNELNICVADTGIGIPSDRLRQVFDRYHRVQDPQSDKVGGAGIGLALVKSLVEVHLGRIELQSEPGQGTEVNIYLPIVDEVQLQSSVCCANQELVNMELMSITGALQASQPDEQPDDVESSQQPLVLVIEDNADMCSYIQQAIAPHYRVISAEDGEKGVNKAIEQVPDLIISDIMMPVKDGYQVTAELRENPLTNHIPIVLLTAKGDRDSRLKGWDEKADEYLTKPFDADELNLRLQNLLSIRNILKKRFAGTTFEQPVLEVAKDNKQQQFIDKLDSTIEGFYTDASISIADFADKMAMSERQLFRKLKSVLDVTPAEYLRRYRLEKAKTLLAQGQSVSFVTFEVGFSTQSYFGKCFKAQYGVSPGEYKKNLTKTF